MNREVTEIEETLYAKYEFREIRLEEAGQAAAIEKICFPPNEACSEKMMWERVAAVPELFLVAVDRTTGRLAGFLNGLSTNEIVFRDEFFKEPGLCDKNGKTVMLLGLDVLPEHRGQGLARALMMKYLAKEKQRGRERVVLTCLEDKIEMYERMGYQNLGLSKSAWGGEPWYEMSIRL